MKRSPIFLGVFLMLILAFGNARAEIELSGYLENQERVGIAYVESEDEIPLDIMMADTWFDAVVRGSGFEGKARMYVNFDLRHFALERESEDALELRLREGWVGFEQDFFSFEVGKKIYIWGMADEMNPTDLINGEDLRWFFTYDKPQRKLGDYSAGTTFNFSNVKIQAVWIPIFSPTILPGSRETWTPWKLQVFYDFVDRFPEFVQFDGNRLPDTSLANSSGAIRVGAVVGPVDFEVMAYDGWDHLPTFDVRIDTSAETLVGGGMPLVLREEYQRFNAYGGSITGVAGPVTFRAEGAYYTDRYFMHSIDEAMLNPGNLVTAFNLLRQMEDQPFRSKKESFQVVGGIDYRYSDLFYTNVQYFHIQILDYEDILMDYEIDNGVTAKFEFSFLDETLKVAADTAYNFSQEDWFAKPYVSYLLTDSLELEVGAQFFGGDYETNFGEFDENDYAYTRLRFSY